MKFIDRRFPKVKARTGRTDRQTDTTERITIGEFAFGNKTVLSSFWSVKYDYENYRIRYPRGRQLLLCAE